MGIIYQKVVNQKGTTGPMPGAIFCAGYGNFKGYIDGACGDGEANRNRDRMFPFSNSIDFRFADLDLDLLHHLRIRYVDLELSAEKIAPPNALTEC